MTLTSRCLACVLRSFLACQPPASSSTCPGLSLEPPTPIAQRRLLELEGSTCLFLERRRTWPKEVKMTCPNHTAGCGGSDTGLGGDPLHSFSFSRSTSTHRPLPPRCPGSPEGSTEALPSNSTLCFPILFHYTLHSYYTCEWLPPRARTPSDYTGRTINSLWPHSTNRHSKSPKLAHLA